MQCRDFENLLSEYLDGAATPIDSAMTEHRSGCERCETLYRQVAGVVQDLSTFPQLEVPEQLVQTILTRTSGPRRGWSWRQRLTPAAPQWVSPRFALATCMMFVFFSLGVNLLGPDFSAIGDSKIGPRTLVTSAEGAWHWAYKRWIQINDTQNRVVAEIRLLRGDLGNRIDFSMLSVLFKRYDEVIQEQPAPSNPAPSTPAPGTEQKDAPKNELKKDPQKEQKSKPGASQLWIPNPNRLASGREVRPSQSIDEERLAEFTSSAFFGDE